MGISKSLKCFKYDIVNGWWNVVEHLIESEKLLESDIEEVVVLDGNIAMSKMILNWFRKENVKGHASLVLLHFNTQTGELIKPFFIVVNKIQNEDGFSTDLKKSNGIIRLIK